MAVRVEDYIAKLLTSYEETTGASHFKIAERMDIPVSNYYLYRNGMGNPTARTFNKMLAVIQMDHPEIIIETTERSFRQLMGSAVPDEEKDFVSL